VKLDQLALQEQLDRQEQLDLSVPQVLQEIPERQVLKEFREILEQQDRLVR
jgi:hypothetical protein